MISLINKEPLPSPPCAGSFVGIKIKANFLSYGADKPFCLFWVQTNEYGPTALICKFEDTLLITAEPSADIDELKEFCDVIGYTSIQAEQKLLNLMGFNPLYEYEVLKLTAMGTPSQSRYSAPPLKAVYDIIFFEDNKSLYNSGFEGWYADLSHRIRHGTAIATCEEGAACIASHITNNAAVISGVATLPNQRGKGLGSKVLKETALHLSGRNIFVAAKKGVSPFYAKNGFLPIDKLGIYIAKEV